MSDTLSQRLLTAGVLIPIVVAIVLLAPSSVIALVFSVFVLGAAWEWAGLSGFSNVGRIGFAALCVVLLYVMLESGEPTGLSMPVLAVGILWWLVASVWVLGYQLGRTEGSWFDARWARVPIGLLLLVPTVTALLLVHAGGERGPALLLTLMVLTWGADTGAYASGRLWGKHRLASRVSPGKTWEGFAGGLVVALLVAWCSAFWLGMSMGEAIRFMVLCGATAAASVLGDLTESLFKRRSGAKDSSSLLPGHGGVLDRVDSLCAAAPVFALGLGLIGITA